MSVKDFISPDLNLDLAQLDLVDKLEIITNALIAKPSRLSQLFTSNHYIKSGLYLYGGVGSGKTMLMHAFYNNLKHYNISASILHYQNFMLSLHKNLHTLHSASTNKIIADLAIRYTQEWDVLCLDELEIKDITDAMIIERLFCELDKHHIFIFITSNTKPEELYKDGLQRDLFIPFIEHVHDKFDILCINNSCDYRLYKSIATNNRVLYPLTPQIHKKIQDIIIQLIGDNILTTAAIEVFGRLISFQQTYKNILVTNFQELCAQTYGYADYVNICQRFNIIIVEHVTIIAANNNDLVTRFINFIDNAYFYKVLLFITLQDMPEKIYQDGARLEDFKRTVSRLHEMNSDTYHSNGGSNIIN